MSVVRHLWALFRAVFPPKRSVVHFHQPLFAPYDWALLECGHRQIVIDYDDLRRGYQRCQKCSDCLAVDYH